MATPAGFGNLVPGFEFLQTLAKNAGAAMPHMGQWVAPVLDPDEIEKRIGELKTVQFWLEQNARLLGATVQALEVQKMTLSTLKTMNVQMGDLAESMKLRMPEAAVSGAGTAMPGWPMPPTAAPAGTTGASAGASPSAAGTPGMVDPMQWWGALTQQFTHLAGAAMKDGVGSAAKGFGANPGGGDAAAAAPDASASSTAPADADAASAAATAGSKRASSRRP